MSRPNVRVFLALLGGIASSAFGSSADVDRLAGLSLEEILNTPVASLTRTSKPLIDHPMSVSLVTREQITSRGYRDLLDVLRDLPGVYVVDLANSEHAASEVMVRGIDANTKMLFLLDGEDITPATGEPFTFLRTVPLIEVKQIEVSYGSASSLYGPDAIAGIVNVVTLDPSDAGTPRSQTWLGAGAHDTWEAQYLQELKLGPEARLSFGGAYYTSAQEDLARAYPKTFGGYAIDPRLESHQLHLRMEVGKVSLSYLRMAGRRNNGLGFLPSLYDYSGRSTWSTINDTWNVGWNVRLGEHLESTTRVAFAANLLDPTSTYRTDFSGGGHFDTHSFEWKGRTSRLGSALEWRSDRGVVIGGGDLSWSESRPKTDLDYPLGSYFVEYRNVGAYTQWEYKATNWLETTAGVRFDQDSRFSGTWNPRLGLLLRPSSDLRVHAGWGTAYLAPAPHKVYERWGEVVEGGFVHLPNPDLQPEESSTVDVGVDWFPAPNSHLGLAGFFTSASDLWRISFKGPTRIDGINVVYQTNDNVADSSIRGLQLDCEVGLGRGFKVANHYTLTTGEQDAVDLDGDVRLNHMPVHVLQTTACWAAHGTSVRATGRWFDRVTTNQQNTLYRGETLRGVWTADLNARRTLTIGRNQFSLGLEVRNLFDRSYEKVSRFDEFFFALPANPQPRRTTGLMLQASF